MRPEVGGSCLQKKTRAASPRVTLAAGEVAQKAFWTSVTRRGTPPRAPDPDASLTLGVSLRRPEVGFLSCAGSTLGCLGRSQFCFQPQAFVPASAPFWGASPHSQKQPLPPRAGGIQTVGLRGVLDICLDTLRSKHRNMGHPASHLTYMPFIHLRPRLLHSPSGLSCTSTG